MTAAQLNSAAIDHARNGRLDAALRLFQLEHALNPDGRALSDVAQVQAEQGNVEAAVENFYASAKLLDTPAAWSQYLSWGLHLRYDGAAHLQWARNHHVGFSHLQREAQRTARTAGPIRVGYLAASFHDCACGHFLRPVIESHNPDVRRFQFACYNSGPRDEWTGAFREHAFQWRNVDDWEDRTLYHRIVHDELDVLVDIEGHKRRGRPMVLAALQAEIGNRESQIPAVLSYVGYAADTFLATNIDPIGWAWQPHDDPPPITELPFDRNGYVTFGHVGRACKITIPVARLWARVLSTVPTARLKVWAVGGERNTALRRRLVENGIAGERLSLIDRRPVLSDYLADITEIDLSLDTFPFAGCATTCELIWQGVPTITLAGDAPYQKIGPMLARAAGLPGLIVQSEDAYVEKAVEIASRSFSLGAMRSTIRDRLKKSPLLDGRAIAAKLEDAYQVAARGLELSSC